MHGGDHQPLIGHKVQDRSPQRIKREPITGPPVSVKGSVPRTYLIQEK